MSKISIEGTPVSIKKLWVLIFLPMLFSCHSSYCPSSSDLTPYNCDQCGNYELFTSCIKNNFPVGSSYIELSNYMEKIGFKKVEDPDDFKENKFYFRWSANNLANVKVGVLGHYSEQLKIIEINVIPKI